ncbi:MAG: flagellar motor protein MotB [Phycisphaeraceae bacterium]
MAKRQKKQEEGAPLWMLTYGDMMTLLLVFFVMLVAMSEIKKEDVQKVKAEVLKAFGLMGGGGKLATDQDPEMSFMQRIEHMAMMQQREDNTASTVDPGMEGRESKVTRVREGMRFAVGGRVIFDSGSADLTEEARSQLRGIADELRGFRTVIELRGHAATLERPRDETDPDPWGLSYARAKAVMDYLTGNELGIDRRRVRLIATADHEPLDPRAYVPSEQASNRRVEVVVIEALVQQFNEPEMPQPPGELLPSG